MIIRKTLSVYGVIFYIQYLNGNILPVYKQQKLKSKSPGLCFYISRTTDGKLTRIIKRKDPQFHTLTEGIK